MRYRLAIVACVSLALFLVSSPTRAGDAKTGFLPRVHKGPDGDSKYVLFVPHGYTGAKEYPLILFLHGAGERGDDGETPVKQGIGNAIKFKGGEQKFPFFVIFPQARVKGSWKAGMPDADRALAILAEVQKAYKIDNKRLYLTGLSMGGSGTWSLAAAEGGFSNPPWPDGLENPSSAAPICGGSNPATATMIKDIPCWCFCGDKDGAKLVESNRTMIKALQAVGGTPRYSEFPFVGHNSWDPAYATPELYSWFLSHKLK